MDQSQYHAAKLYAVIQFQRAVTFPRFSMRKYERWGFVVHGECERMLNAIKAGERFEFAGGQCLAEDVRIIYEGPGDLNYSIARGDVVANPTDLLTAP